MIHRAIAGIACAVALAGCASKVGGASASGGSVMLEFRKVVQTERVDGKAHSRPAVAVPVDQAEVDKAKAARQRIAVSDRGAVRNALDKLDCAASDPLQGKDEPTLPLVTCDPAAPAKYVLEPAFLTGVDIKTARAELSQTGEWTINVTFTDAAARTWADFTTRNVNQQVAVLVDAQVVSAPTIQEPILAGNTMISGTFTKQEAEDLARKLGSA